MNIKDLYPTDEELIRPPRYTDEEFGQAVKLLQEHHSYADSVELAQRIASTKFAVDNAVRKIVEYIVEQPRVNDATWGYGLFMRDRDVQALKELIK